MKAPNSIVPAAAQGIRAALLRRDTGRRMDLKSQILAASRTSCRNDLLPPLTVISRPVSSLREPGRNVRAVRQAHVKGVLNAISELGFTVPILIDQSDTIIDGVIRCRAARELGMTEIPCVVVQSLSATDRRLLRLASNRLAERGEWDAEALRLEFHELTLEQAPISISGFEEFEIECLLAQDGSAVEQGPCEPSEDRPTSRVGDVFLLGSHRVLCGDALDRSSFADLLEGDQARFVFTDVPYNVKIAGHVTKGRHREFVQASGEMSDDEYHLFNERWIAHVTEHLCDGGIFATFIDWRGLMSITAASLCCGLNQLNVAVWAKINAGMGSLYRSQHEMVPLFKKGTAPHVNNVGLGRKGRWRSNLWYYPGASSVNSDARKGLKFHPTVKPVAMLVDALKDVTDKGDIVVDPFLGSGSTLIAAENTGRVCVGIELDPRYVDVIMLRYKAVTGRDPVLRGTGETFQALSKRRNSEWAADQVSGQPDHGRGPTGRHRPARAAIATTGLSRAAPEPLKHLPRERRR